MGGSSSWLPHALVEVVDGRLDRAAILMGQRTGLEVDRPIASQQSSAVGSSALPAMGGAVRATLVELHHVPSEHSVSRDQRTVDGSGGARPCLLVSTQAEFDETLGIEGTVGSRRQAHPPQVALDLGAVVLDALLQLGQRFGVPRLQLPDPIHQPPN